MVGDLYRNEQVRAHILLKMRRKAAIFRRAVCHDKLFWA